MGRAARPKPERLAEKLLYVRTALGLSQSELIRRLDVDELVTQNRVSTYETGTHEPSLIVLLQYARIAGVHLEDLVDDEVDLPKKLPGPVKHKRMSPKLPASVKNR